MPIHQIAPRVAKFQGVMPSFPAQVELQAVLGPDELFGEADLSGRLTLSPPGQQVQLAADMFHGGFKATSKARLVKPNVTVPFFDLSLAIEGKIARVYGELNSESALQRAIVLCVNSLPGFISGALGAPVIVEDLYGNVGTAFFQVEIRGTFERVLVVLDPNVSISKQMTALQQLPADAADRVFAAQRYVNQAQWLGYLAKHSQQFSGEQLLNLQKAIEILHPHSGKIDELRNILRGMGLREEVVQLFASISFVRNSVDVGHPRIAIMDEEQYNTFHSFITYATQMVTWLINYTVEKLAQDTDGSEPKPHVGSPSSDLSKTLDAVKDLMSKVNPLQPSTFFGPSSITAPGPQKPKDTTPKKNKKDRQGKKS